MRFLAGIVFFCSKISALAFDAPEATPVINNFSLDTHGWSPRPTEAPEFNDLVRRQASGISTLIEAPDAACGYKFGISSSAWALCGSSKCGFATTPLGYGSVYCFGSTTTQARYYTSCNGGNAAPSCLSDSSCKANSLIAICTGTQSLCNVGTFFGLGVTAVWCDSSAYPGTVTLSTTYAGQVGRSLSTVGFVTPSATTKPTSTSSSVSSSKSSSSSSATSSSTSSRLISSSMSTQSPTSSVSRSTTTSPTVSPTISPVPPTPQSKTPIGTIVGGVVGGVALIAAIAVGIFFFLRQRKRKDQQTTPEISGPPPSQTNNPHPQYPSEKYAATTQATYMAPGSTLVKPGEQFQYHQQPPQPQYQQNSVPQQYNAYQPVPQQQPSGHQTQQYYPQDAQDQSQNLPVQPQPTSHELSDANRGSVVSGISAPGSPAPPYTGTIPTVPEVPGQSSHHARPIPDRYEMPGAH